jgi:hypothetical protein
MTLNKIFTVNNEGYSLTQSDYEKVKLGGVLQPNGTYSDVKPCSICDDSTGLMIPCG